MPSPLALRARSARLCDSKPRPIRTRRLRIESLEDRALLAADPLPNEWATGDGGTKNLYTGLAWLDARGPSGSWMSWSYAQTYAANSTLGGQTDWRVPTLAEAQQAAQNQMGAQGIVFGAPNTLYWHWTSTTSGSRNAWAVRLADPAGSSATFSKGSAFALNMVRDTATTIDDGTAGYADTGWSTKNNSAAHAGDYRQRAAGSGSHTATWTFSGLEIGATYKVAATWVAGSSFASNAPYTVLDGAAIEQTVLVNQKIAPNDFAAGSQSWEGLGTFTIDSGTISVQLSNLANGTVIADAVRLFKVADAPAPPTALAAPEDSAGASTIDDQHDLGGALAYLLVNDADPLPPADALPSDTSSESDSLTSAGGLDPAAVDEALSEQTAEETTLALLI
jgi:hypothetical protein